MIKFIHTGDLHLGSQFKSASFHGTVGKNRRMELWETFKRIINRGKENSVDFLFITGDIFEEDVFNLGDIRRLRDSFLTLNDTKIIISTGNHDTLKKSSLYELIEWPENVYIFGNKNIEKFEFQELNTVIWGFSWEKNEYKSSDFLEFQDLDPNKTNILLIHGDLTNSESNYLPLDKNKLVSIGFNYIALGHIHKPKLISEKIAYCGSPEPLDFGETGVHGIIEGIVDKSKVNLELINFSKRQFQIKEINIDSLMNYDEVIESIINCDKKENKEKDLYRIILTGLIDRDIKLDIKELKSYLASEFYYVEVIDNTVLDYDLERLKEDNRDNVIGIFIEKMEEKDLQDPIVREALYMGLESLLQEKVVTC
ncbi:MAG TPA: DNA repair exonuclease [Tissierellales bacterium]|nr:DNA repair exonuclease [Tissierellales bacterium]